MLALSGCSTVQSRIEENQAVFNSLDPKAQSNIRQGVIDIGYTMTMVYMALGRADNAKESTSKEGTLTTWIYNSYYQDYEGSRFVGYRRQVYFDPQIRAYRVYLIPVHAEVYSERTEENTRVIFKNGNVTAIEQAK